MRRARGWCIGLLLCVVGPCLAAPTSSVHLEELTSPELAAAVAGGSTTILLPVGGTEQNGPHMVLGKHNVRVRVLAGRIAAALGQTLVAPVLAYVPEGGIAPPSGHMRFAGTISVPEPAFRSVLESAARSLRSHGFRDIVLLGDSGNYQASLGAVAQRLNREWVGTGVRAHHLAAYYRATQTTYIDHLRAEGLSSAQIGTHAGAADTALSLAVAPELVRTDLLTQAARAGAGQGIQGDPRRASVALGQAGVDAIVTQSVAAIRQAVSAACRPGALQAVTTTVDAPLRCR